MAFLGNFLTYIGQKGNRIEGKFDINHLLQTLCLVNDEPE